MVAQARFEAMVPLGWGARRLLPTTAGGPLGQQPLENGLRHPDHAAVLADLDPNSTAWRSAFPAGVLGK